MRKWNRNRGRQPKTGQSGSGAPQQPQSEASEDRSEPEVSPAEQAPEAAEAGTASPAASRSRSRRGRRKKKPAAAPAEPVQQPLQPAYTATEGPRPVSPVLVTAGAPTGEAAELEEPAEAVQPTAPVAAPGPEAPTPAAAAKRVSKGAVVLSVGLPGSGKTTWFKRKGVTPLSSDLLRSLLFDDATEQRHQDLVFSSLRSLLRARMIARMPANYVDATNLSPKERRHWIRMAREFGYEAHAVYFDVPLEVCLERNRKRQRVVPEEVMQRMAAKLRPPTFEEGFSKIVVVRVKQHATASDAGLSGKRPGSEADAQETEGQAAELTPGLVESPEQGFEASIAGSERAGEQPEAPLDEQEPFERDE